MWGATQGNNHENAYSIISIHAPRVGSDPTIPFCLWVSPIFQSTLPVWGATWIDGSKFVMAGISIHAPRVGSDKHRTRLHLHPQDFNPRSPCGERLEKEQRYWEDAQFQSTLPVWGATGMSGGTGRE